MAILSAVADFLKLLGVIFGLIQEERQRQTGIDLQAGADAKAALAAADRVAVVAAQPVTDADVDKALSPGGDF